MLGARPDSGRDRGIYCRIVGSGGLCEGEQLEEIVGRADHGPLGAHFLDAPQQELAEAACWVHARRPFFVMADLAENSSFFSLGNVASVRCRLPEYGPSAACPVCA